MLLVVRIVRSGPTKSLQSFCVQPTIRYVVIRFGTDNDRFFTNDV